MLITTLLSQMAVDFARQVIPLLLCGSEPPSPNNVGPGPTTHGSSGPDEGRVNHIKMIKRQMFGRAGLPLLRKRVLLTAGN